MNKQKFGSIVFMIAGLLMFSVINFSQERKLVSGGLTRLLYDNGTQKNILINGGNDRGPWHTKYIELWQWNGTNWDLLSDSGPEVRNFFSCAYDDARGVLVLYGGNMATGRNLYKRYNDTWEWDGKTWKEIHLSVNPGIREAAQMVYDPVRKACILFGGSNEKFELLNDTWSYDGKEWKKIFSDGPSPRFAATMFYFPVNKTIYIYGGRSPGPTEMVDHADMWELTATGWKEIETKSKPGIRLTTETIFNEKTRTIWMIGGDGESPGEIWFFNGKEWIISGINIFQTRSFPAVCYDKGTGSIILRGGVNVAGGPKLNDTWTFDGKVWKCVDGCTETKAQ